MLGVLTLGSSLCAGRKVRAIYDEAVALNESNDQLREKDRAQWQAALDERFPAFQASRPGMSDAEYAASRLRLYDVNAERAISVSPFLPDGQCSPHGFSMLREFMRCRRTGHTMDMSADLVRLLMRIAKRFDNAELHVISAHRAVDGVVTSERSQHGKGTASDIRIEGVPIEALAAVARQEGARGIGMYPKSRFVHVDVREKPYSWVDNGDVEDDERDLREPTGEEAEPGVVEGESPAVEAEAQPPADENPGEGPFAAPAQADHCAGSRREARGLAVRPSSRWGLVVRVPVPVHEGPWAHERSAGSAEPTSRSRTGTGTGTRTTEERGKPGRLQPISKPRNANNSIAAAHSATTIHTWRDVTWKRRALPPAPSSSMNVRPFFLLRLLCGCIRDELDIVVGHVLHFVDARSVAIHHAAALDLERRIARVAAHRATGEHVQMRTRVDLALDLASDRELIGGHLAHDATLRSHRDLTIRDQRSIDRAIDLHHAAHAQRALDNAACRDHRDCTGRRCLLSFAEHTLPLRRGAQSNRKTRACAIGRYACAHTQDAQQCRFTGQR
jgi:uncharacterized protein YcbK (DUF882 family)